MVIRRSSTTRQFRTLRLLPLAVVSKTLMNGPLEPDRTVPFFYCKTLLTITGYGLVVYMVSRRRALKLLSIAVLATSGCNTTQRNRENEQEKPGDDNRTPTPINASVDEPSSSADTNPDETPEPSDDMREQPDPVHNIRDFGAAGDGVTDDTPAIQDAINAASSGETVLIPRSDHKYIISPRVGATEEGILQIRGNEIPDNLTIQGEGRRSVLKFEQGRESLTHQMFRVDIEDGISGLEIRDLVLEGSSTNANTNRSNVMGIRCGHANGAARGNIDVLVEDVLCQNVHGTAFKANSGGVWFNRCTAINTLWHGFESTANKVQDGNQLIENPPTKITNSYALRCGLRGGGHYGLNSSGGRSIAMNFVADNCLHGTKVTSPTTSAEYYNVRIRNSIGQGFGRSSDSGYPQITWGDVILENNGGRAITGRKTSHTVLPGTEIISTANGANVRWDIHFYQGSSLDAEDGAIYVNNSKAETALGWDSEKTGKLGLYGTAGNPEATLDANGNLMIDERRTEMKTDIESVPAANEVGAWSPPDLQDRPNPT